MLFAQAKPLDKGMMKKYEELGSKESKAALINGSIDGYFTVTGHPSSEIKELAQAMDIDIVNVSPDSCLAVRNILIKNPFFTLGEIPANTYEGIHKNVQSFGVKATLITNADADYKTVLIIVKSIMENFEEFKKLHPVYKNIKKSDVIKGLGAPLHPAARDYYKKHEML